MMKEITEIVFGFSDAENYRRRENKDLFNQIFLRTTALEQLNRPSTFFLVGEKGTGKTAYAVYYSNSPYRNNNAIHKYIRDTDYQKFIYLRQNNNLSLSDYTDIWKVIIYLIISEAIYASVNTAQYLIRFPKFKALKDAIEEYYDSAFSPEIATALQFVENSELAAKIMAKHAIIVGSTKINKTKKTSREGRGFQTNLLSIERAFQEALASISMQHNQLFFIDGVDIRPASVPYPEYLDCVKGLANAVWSVNNDFFPSIRDSKGRMRVILLLRPDIFNSLGLQNRNTKLRDNSTVLDWRTVYYDHRSSNLFKMADRLFAAQQDDSFPIGKCWDSYFPFMAANVRAGTDKPTSFVVLMRYSFHRPRDILTILDILRENYDADSGKNYFEYKDLVSSEFKRTYGDYLLGELKDSLSFYYDEREFEIFLKFFEFLDGMQKFSYEKYLEAFARFTKFLASTGGGIPDFMKLEEDFLQFLYDQNVLSYVEHTEDERFIRWCFIERSPSNISPKVKIGLEYEIHYGLANVLNTGKEIKRPGKNVIENLERDRGKKAGRDKQHIAAGARGPKETPPPSALENSRDDDVAVVPPEELQSPSAYSIGTVKMIDSVKKFGFIKQDGKLPDVHFRLSAVAPESPRLRRGSMVEFELVRGADGRPCAHGVKSVSQRR